MADKEIIPINSTTYEVELAGGDKVQIGDKESADFKPHLKLNRFGGECSFSESLPPDFIGQLARADVDKVTWEGKWNSIDVFAEFFPQVTSRFPLGTFELQLNISSKPASNKLYLPISLVNLKAFLQPPLSQFEIDRHCVRPEDIVNSIAFYHTSKGGIPTPRDIAKGITTGKAFHNLRPKLVDAHGNWVWGFIELWNGFKIITIPLEFLEYAHYPIRHAIGDTFGITSEGGSGYSLDDTLAGMKAAPAGGNGTGDSIGCYLRYTIAIHDTKCSLYDNEAISNIITNGATEEKSVNQTNFTLFTFDFLAAPDLVNGTTYRILAWGEQQAGDADLAYDFIGSPDGNVTYAVEQVYNGWPADVSFTFADTLKMSIYCTYTPAAPPAPKGGSMATKMVAGNLI